MLKTIIVDDDAIVRLTLQTILDWEESGFQVVGAYANGKQALRYITEHQQVDLVITDINMPIMNGIELIEAIKGMGIFTEFLVISSYDDYELVRKAFKLGVNDYILKPEINHDSMQLLLSTIASRFKKKNIPQNLKTNENYQEQWLSTLLFDETDIAAVNDVKEQLNIENYVICIIMVEDYKRILERFGQNLQEALVIPFEETVKQVMIEKKNYFLITSRPEEHVLILHNLVEGVGNELISEQLKPLLNRIQLQLKSFLNISVTMTISSFGKGAILFPSIMKPLKEIYDGHILKKDKKILGMMLIGDRLGVDLILEDISRKAIGFIVDENDMKNVVNFYLILICEVGSYLNDIQDDLLNVFRKNMNYYERLLC